MLDSKQYYKGFCITTPSGNNSFSFHNRIQKTIFVPPLKKGTPSDLEIGEHIAFSEVIDGKECNFKGLKNFIHFETNKTEILIFDNHNHAFFFWAYAFTPQHGSYQAEF